VAREAGSGGGDVFTSGACCGHRQAWRWTFGDPYNSTKLKLKMQSGKQFMQFGLESYLN